MNAAGERDLRKLFARVEFREDVTWKQGLRNVAERTGKFIDATGFHFRVQSLDTPTAQVAVGAIFLFRIGVHNVPLGNMVYYRFDTHSQAPFGNGVRCKSPRVLN
jgi:hypothetical protein